jgi:phosphoglycerate dehydrogenase-like enzyme
MFLTGCGLAVGRRSVRDQVMSLTIWTNHGFRPEVLKEFRQRLEADGHQLIVSPKASPIVLAAGGPDPSLELADVAFGQPDVAQTMSCARLKFLELSTAGYARYERPDFRAAMKARGVPVTNASQVFADPCAQHVLAQMLALVRNLPVQLRNQDGSREWRYLEDRFTNGVLTRHTVLLLGYGAIGRRLATLLQPFGTRVLAFRRTPTAEAGVTVIGEAGLAAALAAADHVVNIFPDSPATTGWMSAARFAAMKPGARFYNIGRGTTVDQAALLAALASGRLGSAYLDVMDPEPLPPAHPLWTARNCYITCHIGGGTGDQDHNLAAHFLANLAAFTRGESLVDKIM